ncbi:MAG: outer membrane protein assembly factor BamA [Hydrogenophilales bacterium 16-64-46]|nr:MAG: outer membrane protein assembly factor BamA [Hydrogenophilales bacterium 12-64-13]OYZ04297.1 MAG: outer membrane protein assembly factor BamA [Hydrogenophilales bacterium 16-64-46]OZA38495.1 MAG: outer membrane protein assembly factor BamA [Hydrogenophilales bacterium 17-64-34]HQT00145.1 outer membrane protein assembly factor BamA [Thiobacillus sp.]
MTRAPLTLALAALLAAPLAIAAEPFQVKDIRVEGIQRTEAGTVFSYLPIRVGETLTDEKTAAAIKALYATGFFKDVRIEALDGVVIVTVEERPSIAQITLNGIKEFSEEDLKNGLKQTGLAEGRVLDRSLLDKAEQELQRQYFNRGKYAVEIKSTLTPLERNRVAVQFDVVEGDSARIQQINIVGNQAFGSKELLKQFTSTTPGWLTWYTKNDQYSKSRLAGDIEALRSFYLNRGYLEFNVESTQVTISPDKQGIYITVNVSEGPQYTVTDVKLAGQMLVPEEELKKLITLKPGDIFQRDRLTETTKKISERLGNDGYAFANVNAVPELEKDKHTVAFTLFVDPGRRVYVNRVNVSGNTKTRDEVVRREVRQMEGAYYDAEKINLSRDRLNRLGYFNEVNIETPPVQGTTDQVDVNVSVAEKSTGNIQLGAGFSSSEGFVLSGSVSQSNVFGTGNRLSAQINSGSVNTVYALSFTNPYYTIDGISLGYDLFRRDVDATELDSVGDYETSTYGAGVRFGLPVNERDFISLGLTYEQTSVTTTADSPQQYIDFVNEFGNDNDTVRVDTAWSRDTRNSFLFPTKGLMQRLSAEVGTPLGSLQYYKLTLQHQQYFPLGRNFTLMLNGEAGVGGGLSGKPLPFFKNFYAGGNSSIRGFESGTLGPKDANGDALGGDKRVVGNAELFFPLPGLKDDQSLRMSAFLDAGATFGPNDQFGDFKEFAIKDLRYSTGLAVLWVSPLGPLKFSLAQPLTKKARDQEEIFQFTLGNVF